jgi:histone deacetylase 1/2
MTGDSQENAEVIAIQRGIDDRHKRVWRLTKALYGLKQAARAWHEKLKQKMMKLGYLSSKNDPYLFFR